MLSPKNGGGYKGILGVETRSAGLSTTYIGRGRHHDLFISL